MTDQICYNIAETLAHNKDYIKSQMRLHYIKAQRMPRDEAIYYIEDGIKDTLVAFTSHTLLELEHAFADERVKIIIDRYFLKEFIYEH